jgi:hypothetical protein
MSILISLLEVYALYFVGLLAFTLAACIGAHIKGRINDNESVFNAQPALGEKPCSTPYST